MKFEIKACYGIAFRNNAGRIVVRNGKVVTQTSRTVTIKFLGANRVVHFVTIFKSRIVKAVKL